MGNYCVTFFGDDFGTRCITIASVEPLLCKNKANFTIIIHDHFFREFNFY
jgi:hypothetical protein